MASRGTWLSAVGNGERSESGERGEKPTEQRVAPLQLQHELSARSYEQGRDREVPVTKSFGPQVTVLVEVPEQLGPPAQVQAGRHDEEPRPIRHEPVLSEHRQTEVLLELSHP